MPFYPAPAGFFLIWIRPRIAARITRAVNRHPPAFRCLPDPVKETPVALEARRFAEVMPVARFQENDTPGMARRRRPIYGVRKSNGNPKFVGAVSPLANV